MIKIIDNWLDKDLSDFVEDNFLHKYPHYFDHYSTNNSKTLFYNCELNQDDMLVKLLFYKAQKNVNKKIKLIRSHFNIQHPKMKGDWHVDYSNVSFVYMVTQTLNKKEGTFDIKINNKLHSIDFVKNRLLIFDSNLLHRGNAPLFDKKRDINIRITLALKADYV
jgi:hypothetical protein